MFSEVLRWAIGVLDMDREMARRDHELEVEAQRLITRIAQTRAHLGCYCCARGLFPGHDHIAVPRA